jgi:hypothetical protein
VGRFERPSIPPVIAVPSPDKTGNYTLANYADDLKSYAAATGDAATALRNKMVYSVLAEIDYVFYDYETKLFLNEGRFNVAADFLQLGMAAGGTLTNGARGKTILSALLTGVTGVNLSVDKNFFRQQTVQAIASSMEANRDRIKTVILQQLSKDTIAYPYQAARADLIHYFFAGTLPSGLQQLNQDAGSNAKSEKAALNQAQVTNITSSDVVSISAINTAIAKAFSTNNLGPVEAYLKEMGIAVPPSPTKDTLEDEIRQLGIQLPEDPALRKKAYAAAKTANLIQ